VIPRPIMSRQTMRHNAVTVETVRPYLLQRLSFIA
jgi:hypothetical protein